MTQLIIRQFINFPARAELSQEPTAHTPESCCVSQRWSHEVPGIPL